MADAIPVGSTKPKPNVKPSPTHDANGVPIPGDYVSKVRENLGDPSYFNQEPASVREMEQVVEMPQMVNGVPVSVPYVHKYTRVDH